jgi:hypothetical protein
MEWTWTPIRMLPSLYLCLPLPWRWRWQIPPQYSYPSTKLHNPVSRKTVISLEKCSLCGSQAAGKVKCSVSRNCCVGVGYIRRTAAVCVMQLHLPSVSACRCWHFRASAMTWVPEVWNILIYSAFPRSHTPCKLRDISGSCYLSPFQLYNIKRRREI